MASSSSPECSLQNESVVDFERENLYYYANINILLEKGLKTTVLSL